MTLSANSVVLLRRHSAGFFHASVFLEEICMEIKCSVQVHSFLPLATIHRQDFPASSCVAKDYAAGADELLNRSWFCTNGNRKEEGQGIKGGNSTERDAAAPELKCLKLTLQNCELTLIQSPLQ